MDTPTPAVKYEGTQQQILELLGQGLGSSAVASATGVSESYVSQLLSQEEFRSQVRQRRVANLQAATSLDQGYSEIEKIAQEKLRRILPAIVRPKDLLEVIKVINATKRRGAAGDEPTEARVAHIIDIRMPSSIVNQFIGVQQIQKDSNNQIIRTGEQSLLTAQPQNIRELAQEHKENKDESNRKAKLPEPSKAAIRGGPRSLSLEDLE